MKKAIQFTNHVFAIPAQAVKPGVPADMFYQCLGCPTNYNRLAECLNEEHLVRHPATGYLMGFSSLEKFKVSEGNKNLKGSAILVVLRPDHRYSGQTMSYVMHEGAYERLSGKAGDVTKLSEATYELA